MYKRQPTTDLLVEDRLGLSTETPLLVVIPTLALRWDRMRWDRIGRDGNGDQGSKKKFRGTVVHMVLLSPPS